MGIKRYLSGGGGGDSGGSSSSGSSSTGSSGGGGGGGGGIDLPASVRRRLRDAGSEDDESEDQSKQQSSSADQSTSDDPARGKQRAVQRTRDEPEPRRGKQRAVEATTSGQQSGESSGGDSASDMQSGVADAIAEANTSTANGSSQTAGQSTDSSDSGSGGGSAGSVASGIADAATEAAEAGKDAIEGQADAVEQTAQDVTETAQEATETTVQNAQEQVDRAVSDAQSKAEEAQSTVQQKRSEIRQDIGQQNERLEQQVDETVPDPIAGGADVLAGSTDEAAGRYAAHLERGEVGKAADDLAGSTDEAVGRAVADAREGDVAGVADNLAGGTDEAVSGVPGDVTGTADFAAGSTDETVGRAVEDLQRGDVAAAAEEVRGGVTTEPGESRTATRVAAGAADVAQAASQNDRAAMQSEASDLAQTIQAERERVEQNVASAERSQDLGLTEGGVLSEEDEQKLGEAARYVSGGIEDASDQAKHVVLGATGPATSAGLARDVAGSSKDSPGEKFASGAVKTTGETANVFRLAQTAETAGEVATNIDEAERQGKGREVAETAGATARDTGAAAVESARKRPVETAGGVTAGLLLTYGSGAAIEKTATSARVASRAARGRSKIDVTEETNPETVAALRGDGGRSKYPSEDRRPGEGRVEAFERQARENTAEPVERAFDEAGVNEGVVVKHVSGKGKMKGESRVRGTIETDRDIKRRDDPKGGMFVSPEASLYFTRASESSAGLRPRLPGTGKPSRQIAIKTDVDKEPDTVGYEGAGEPGPESQFLADREGEPTAYLRSEANRNPGEVEAVIPPGAKFERVSKPGYKRFRGDLIDVEAYKPVRRRSSDDSTGTGTATETGTAATGTQGQDVLTYEQVLSRSRRYDSREGQPVGPAAPGYSTTAPDSPRVDASDPAFRGTTDETGRLRDRLDSVKRDQRDAERQSTANSTPSNTEDPLSVTPRRFPDDRQDSGSTSGSSGSRGAPDDSVGITPPDRLPGGDGGNDRDSGGSDSRDRSGRDDPISVAPPSRPPSDGDGSSGGSGGGSGSGGARSPTDPINVSPPGSPPSSGGGGSGGGSSGGSSGSDSPSGPISVGPPSRPPSDGGGSGGSSGGGSSGGSSGGSPSGPISIGPPGRPPSDGGGGGSSGGPRGGSSGGPAGGSSAGSSGVSRSTSAAGIGSLAGFGPAPQRPPRPDVEPNRRRREREVQPARPRSTGGDWLAPGWLSETVTTIGTKGRGSSRAPSQQTLRRRPATEKLVGELPTYEMLRGDEETQESIAEVQGLLSGDARGRAEPSASSDDERFFYGLGGFDLGDEGDNSGGFSFGGGLL